MRQLFALLVIAHGIAHLVGFAVPFGLVANPDLTARTTVLNGALEVGETGAKVMGILWLALAVGFLAAGAAILAGRWDPIWIVRLGGLSFVFCLIAWPEARIGAAVNLAIVATLFAIQRFAVP